MSKRSTHKTSQEEAADPQQLEGLMTPDEEMVDLDTAAWDAAEQWIADNDELRRESELRPALEEDEDEEPARRSEAPAPPPASSTVVTIDRVLQIMLVVNLLLLGVMLVVPSGADDATSPAPGSGASAPDDAMEEEPDEFVQPRRTIGALPSSGLWEESVRAAGEGDYREAATALQRYLATSPGMSDLERRLVYNQLAFYLTKDGRIAEAHEYERKSQQLMARSYLPEDLLNSARRAAQQGQITAMRSAYARLLLQQKQIPPTLRKSIAEAYLKLGDSYRFEANRSESSSADEQERSK